jgi:hypothetical protein
VSAARKAKQQLDAKGAAKTQRAANIRRRMKRSAGDHERLVAIHDRKLDIYQY